MPIGELLAQSMMQFEGRSSVLLMVKRAARIRSTVWAGGGGVKELYKVNDDARNAECVSITGVEEVDGVSNWKTFLTNLTLRDINILLRVRSKQRKILLVREYPRKTHGLDLGSSLC